MREGQALGVQPEAPARDSLPVERVGVDGVSDGREVDPDLVCPPRLEPHPEHRMSRRLPQHLEVRDGGPADPRCHQDRKSTRLNSSHANISYAVFCLKKKKAIHLTRLMKTKRVS